MQRLQILQRLRGKQRKKGSNRKEVQVIPISYSDRRIFFFYFLFLIIFLFAQTKGGGVLWIRLLWIRLAKSMEPPLPLMTLQPLLKLIPQC
jgi:hypothetical protein